MANTFRQIKPEPVRTEKPQKPPKPRPQSASKQTVPKKGVRKGVRFVRKGFENVFGGGILKKMNLRKNWRFLVVLVGMIIILIYSNLNIQSKRERINKLSQDAVIAKDDVMDAVEEGYNIDKQKEMEVLKEGEEKGFYNNGYLPYIIELENKNE
jgi:hypothetical protein